jgi:hypothetical protein
MILVLLASLGAYIAVVTVQGPLSTSDLTSVGGFVSTNNSGGLFVTGKAIKYKQWSIVGRKEGRRGGDIRKTGILLMPFLVCCVWGMVVGRAAGWALVVWWGVHCRALCAAGDCAGGMDHDQAVPGWTR